LVIFLIPTVFSHAQTATDIQSKIDQNNQNIQSLEQEIAGYQGQLDSIGQQKSSLASSIKQLDLTKKKLNADIAVTQNKIDKTNLTIQNLSSDIVSKESSIQNNIRSIAVGLKNVNELEQTNMLQNIFSQDNFTVVLNDINNISTLRQTIRTDIDTLKQVKGTLEDTRKTTIDAKNQLLHLKSQLSDQQKIIAQNTLEKNNLLTQTKNSEANYQKLLKDRIAKRDIFEKEINDYEMQLQYVLDPSKLPQGRVLSWPMDKIYVTQLFGKTVAAKRLYTSGSHSGVDFRASVGTPVLSMADGVVAGTGNTDLTCYGGSFGKFVFIQYNNGLSSAYGHLSLIKAVEGQTVKRGDVVGYSGNTGHTTGPHLHVSLYAPGAAKMSTLPSAGCTGRKYTLPLAPIAGYLNVLDFLPPYTINTTILNNQTAE
jgi:murein DD-endopeptidase MepM/ murein hydrolase activator NlpD